MGAEGTEGALLCLLAPDEHRDVVIDDDGRVAYAYLREANQIVADVWLYNVGEDPTVADWEISREPPFRNPAHLARKNDLPRITHDSAVACVWSGSGVRIIVDGVLWAELERGTKPGRSRLAKADGPAARVLGPTK